MFFDVGNAEISACSLMNKSSERGVGCIQLLRLVNQFLAKEVLNCLKRKNKWALKYKLLCWNVLTTRNSLKYSYVQS